MSSLPGRPPRFWRQSVPRPRFRLFFAAQMDPVGAGVVASLSRPGGNVTGMSIQQTDTAGKRIELLREVVPNLARLAVMANSGAPGAVLEMREVLATAKSLGRRSRSGRQMRSFGPLCRLRTASMPFMLPPIR